MKIALVVTNSKRKSLIFVSNELNVYTLEEAVQLTHEGKIERAHIVRSNKGTFLRTNPSLAKKDEFDNISITAVNLLLFAQDAHLTEVSPVLKNFILLYRAQLNKNEQLIKPIGQPEVLTISIKEKINLNKGNIFDAAKNFNLDPYIIGAILVDEIARLIPFESIVDKFLALSLGANTSVGIAQVKTDTANNIIKLGLYNPNPKDPKLPFKRLDSTARAHLYTYLIEPKHSIFFASAVIRDIFDSWRPIAGDKLTPAVIATL